MKKTCRILFALVVVGIGNFINRVAAAEPEMIQPDSELQSLLSQLPESNLRTRAEEHWRKLNELRTVADKAPTHLIQQLIWYDVNTAPSGEMTTVEILTFIPGLKSYLVGTVAPLMGKTNSKKTEREIRELLWMIESKDADGNFNFREYESYIRGRIQGNLPFDEPFLAYVFHQAPGRALQAFTIATYSDDRRKPFLWARHVVDDLIWKRNFGFLPPDKPETDVSDQIRQMADSDQWWARAYAAEIIKEHPELGDAKTTDRLKSDKNNIVRMIIEYKN